MVQQGPTAAAQEQPRPQRISLTVVGGEGGANNLGQTANKFPSVRVADEASKPIKGANVVFTLPADGASGEFRNGEKTVIVQTDERGVATATGMKANTVPGRLPIHVHASHRGLTASANITQFNMAVPGKKPPTSRKTLVLIAAAVGGAAAAGGFAATRKGNSPAAAPSTPISISPGGNTVGPPR